MNLQLYLQDFTPFLLQANASHLQRLCAVGQWQRRQIPLSGALLQSFAIAQQHDWPTAALVAQSMGEVQPQRYYLLAHLVQLDLRTDYFALQTLTDISAEQSDALIDSMNQHFADRDFYFAPTSHPHTLLISTSQPSDIQTYEVHQVWGKDIRRYMPFGDDALRWRMMMNEMQMLLHEHAVNQAREQQGQLPINSLWIEGGGCLPKQAPQSGNANGAGAQANSVLMSDSDMVQGLAQLTQCECLELSRSWNDLVHNNHLIQRNHTKSRQSSQQQDNLIIYMQTPAQFDSDWAQGLCLGLRKLAIQQLTIHFAVAEFTFSLTVKPRDVWKFWRRPQALMQYFSEQQFSSAATSKDNLL